MQTIQSLSFQANIGITIADFLHISIQLFWRNWDPRPKPCLFSTPKKENGDLAMIHEENDVLINDEFAAAKDFLKQLKHACLYIRNEHPRWFKMLCSTPAINMKDK